MIIKNSPFRLRAFIDDIFKLFEGSVFGSKLALIVDIDEKTPDLISGDADRLRQVLINLIGNALKFTNEGYVKIIVKVVKSTKKHVLLHFSVKDTGIGISESDQKKIFNKFTQLDASETRPHGGAGLGLSISNQIVALMGGKLGVESTEGVGSEFYFDIDFNDFEYFTDTGRRWNGDDVSVRDKIESGLKFKNKDLKIRNTHDMIESAGKGTLANNILITIHPQRWNDRLVPWLRELVWQDVKNVVKKYYFVKRRKFEKLYDETLKKSAEERDNEKVIIK